MDGLARNWAETTDVFISLTNEVFEIQICCEECRLHLGLKSGWRNSWFRLRRGCRVSILSGGHCRHSRQKIRKRKLLLPVLREEEQILPIQLHELEGLPEHGVLGS